MILTFFFSLKLVYTQEKPNSHQHRVNIEKDNIFYLNQVANLDIH